MIACPRCGRVDDGTSYQCPDCFTVLQPDLATERKRSPRAAAAHPPGGNMPPGAAPPPGAAAPPGPTPDNPYHPPGAPPQPPASHGGYGGHAGYRPVGVPDVPTYLPHAILATLLCCLPFGIVAIVYAAKVGTMQAVGDYHAATDASDKARMWCWISFGCGLVGTVLYLIFMLSVVNQPRHY